MTKVKELGLPKPQQVKLRKLKENEVIYNAERIHYDKRKIWWELKLIDEKVGKLLSKRSEVVTKRLILADIKTEEIRSKLEKNKVAQLLITSSHGLLAKLKKAKRAVKEIENTLGIENGSFGPSQN